MKAMAESLSMKVELNEISSMRSEIPARVRGSVSQRADLMPTMQR
jgi:hypothetical protein